MASEFFYRMATGSMNLYAHQQGLVNLAPKRHLLAWKVGTGKSKAALAVAQKHGGSTLVICTKTLKQARKWEVEYSELHGTVYTDIGRGNLLVISKEEFRRDVRTLPKFDNIIVDEAHLGFGNMKAQLHKALMAYIKVHSPQCVLLLTGTPYTSSPNSIYSLARILGHNWNYMHFRDQFFMQRYLGSRVIFEPRKGIEEDLANKVREMGSIVRMEDCADVPEQTFIDEKFPMTAAQKKAMKKLETSETNPLTKFGKAHQIAQGILIGNEYAATETFEAAKNARVKELAIENEKLVVFSRFNAHLDLLREMLEAESIPTLMLRGDTKDKGEVIELANRLRRVVLLVQAECAEGYELPTFDTMVFASLSYSYVKYAQAQGRVQRINALKKNVYIHLTTEASADGPVREAMDNKIDFSEAIFTRQHFPQHEEDVTN